MLAKYLVLSAVWAICSTVLIWPVFWIRLIKRKPVFNEEDMIVLFQWKNHQKIIIFFEILVASGVFCISISLYILYCSRANIWGSTIQICMILFAQILAICEYRWKKAILLLGILAAFIVCSVMENNSSYINATRLQEERKKTLEIPPIVVEVNGRTIPVPPENTISMLYDAEVEETYLSNGKVIYLLSHESSWKNEVVLFSEGKSKYIPLKVKPNVNLQLREKYPSEILKKVEIVVSEDDTLFQKLVLLKRKKVFKEAEISKYILQNLITGDIEEYNSIDDLPYFAK